MPGKNGAPIHNRIYRGVEFVAYLPTGKEILTLETDQVCRIWKADEGKLVREFKVEALSYQRASLTADGRTLMTIIPTGFVLWDVDTGKLLKRHEFGDIGIHKYAMSPDGKRAFFRFDGQPDERFMVYWDLENHKPIQELKRPNKGEARAKKWDLIIPELFCPDQQQVLARRNRDASTSMILCELKGLKETGALGPSVDPKEIVPAACAVFSADGRKLLTIDKGLADQAHKTWIRLRDLRTGETLWTVTDRPEARVNELLVYSPSEDIALFINGGILATAEPRPTALVLMDMRNGKVIGSLDDRVFGTE
jgi:WD40 repeat protein